MEKQQREFLGLLLKAGALKFGEFVLKSGRQSPYFVNLGSIATGETLAAAGDAYAQAIHDRFGLDFDVVFGPAYKGISLAAATCQALWSRYGMHVGFASDRKEEKDHGEGGRLFGAPIESGTRIIYVDDVISAGTSLRHSLRLFKEIAGADLLGAVVAVDRQERGKSQPVSSIREIESEYGLAVHAILRMREVVDELAEASFEGTVYVDSRLRDEFLAYQRRYGAE